MYYLFVILFSVGWILISIVRNYISTKSPIKAWLGKSLLWVNTLSNFGEVLKLLISSCNWKVVYGWSNSSGMVTSQKICENKTDDRESKSVILNRITGKEQRVHGNGQALHNTCLRCTLKSFEKKLTTITFLS